MKNNSTEKKKFSWFALFNNNRFVTVFSLIASFCIWVLMMNGNTDEMQSWKIDNIPIMVEYTTGAVEAGYKVYDTDRSAVTVSVSGNSLSVRQVQASDIEVVATINDSVKPGSNTITLTARKKSDSLNTFTVESIEPSTITAELDVAKDAAFEIQNGVEATAASHYFISTPQFSVENVVVSGPQSIVSQISKVVAAYSFQDPINETKNFSVPLSLLNEADEPVESEYLELTVDTVDVKLPVLWQQEVQLEATFNNKPTMFPNKLITVSPSTVVFAGPKESFDSIKSITLDPLDFSKVNLSTTNFSLDIITPNGLVNTGNAQSTTVSVDLSGYVERWISIEEIAVVNVPTDVTVSIPDKKMKMLVMGPSDMVGQLTDQNIYARVNLSGQHFEKNGEQQLTVTASIQDNTSCWVCGTYTVLAQIEIDE